MNIPLTKYMQAYWIQHWPLLMIHKTMMYGGMIFCWLLSMHF
jgi:hypothetical protein